MDVEKFQSKISKLKNFNDNYIFPNLSKVAKFVLALPHANSERIFSIITDVLTKKRNKLSHENLTSISIIRSKLQDENQNCCTFQCKESHSKKWSRQNCMTIIKIFDFFNIYQKSYNVYNDIFRSQVPSQSKNFFFIDQRLDKRDLSQVLMLGLF